MITYFVKRLENYSKENLIEEIKRVASLITEQKITKAEFSKHSKAVFRQFKENSAVGKGL